MEGARWDTQQGAIGESKLKELTPAMPVVFVKAIPIGKPIKYKISHLHQLLLIETSSRNMMLHAFVKNKYI